MFHNNYLCLQYNNGSFHYLHDTVIQYMIYHFSNVKFLAPTGALGVTLSVCLFGK